MIGWYEAAGEIASRATNPPSFERDSRLQLFAITDEVGNVYPIFTSGICGVLVLLVVAAAKRNRTLESLIASIPLVLALADWTITAHFLRADLR